MIQSESAITFKLVDGKVKMKIGIIDADLLDNGTRHPNIALMKISGYYRAKKHHVKLLENYDNLEHFDKIFISKVFSYTKIPNNILSLPNVSHGGTGFFSDGGDDLPFEIEHHKPDYDLYKNFIEKRISDGKSKNNYSDYLNYSIGFTTRGCFRKCEFCVNKKYDKPIKHAPVEEFYDETKPYIYLWDDNFLAFQGWEEILDRLEQIGKPFQFRQGLDIRLMTERMAKKLSKVIYHGDFIFAFDHLKDRRIIEKKLKLWRRYTSRTTKLYVLCAYESQDEYDIESVFERIKILMQHGCLPYLMRYETYLDSQWRSLYVQIARWCNQPQFFKKKSFRQFCEANQDYHKNKETLCLAYSSMLEFEQKFPDLAKKYFDLRYDCENRYSFSYGYGRKYPHKKDCVQCSIQQQRWIDTVEGNINRNELLKLYFDGELDLQCLSYPQAECLSLSKEKITNWFINQLLDTPLTSIFEAICSLDTDQIIQPFNIPQFSNFYHAYVETPHILWKAGEGITFEQLGKHLGVEGKTKNEVARRKYGENHSKLATLLDLAVINKPNNSFLISLSVMGEAYRSLSDKEKEQLMLRLLFRIPILQNYFRKAAKGKVTVESELKCLSKTTLLRRKSNIVSLINIIRENVYADEPFARIIDNII